MGGSTSRAGRAREGTDRLKQHNTAPGWGGPGPIGERSPRGPMVLHEVELGVESPPASKLPARIKTHDLAVVQSGGTCTDTDPYEAPRGRGSVTGDPSG
jgi:hypothetical protein